MLERWTRAVVRWRVVVIACWVAIIIFGTFLAVKLPDLLTTSLSVPGTNSVVANLILARHFGENIEGSFSVILHQAPTAQPSLVTFLVNFTVEYFFVIFLTIALYVQCLLKNLRHL
jgi:uncharacterized membrane protein YdfJ with MMPL/SSD domain